MVELQPLINARNWRDVPRLVPVPVPEMDPELAIALRGVHKESVHLEALQGLEDAVSGDRTKVPGAETLEAALAMLGSDRAYVKKYVAARSHLEGQGGLPPDVQPGGEPPKFQTILRDLQAQAAEPAPALPPPANVSPPNLVPEAPPRSLRPLPVEKLGADLPEPELGELRKAELTVRTRVLAMIDAARSKALHQLNNHLHRLGGHAPLDPCPARSDIRCLVCSPDGQWVVYSDDRIHILEAATLRPVAVLEGLTATVNCLAFTPDSKTMISGDANGSIRIWRFDGPKTELHWDLPNFGPHAQVEVVRVAPDGRSLLVVLAPPKMCQVANSPGTSNLVRLWYLSSEMPKPGGYLFFDGSDAFFGEDGKTVITIGKHAVKRWDATRWPSSPTADGWFDELARLIPWWLLIGIASVPVAVVVLYFLDRFRRRVLKWEKYWKAIGCAAVLAVLILLAIRYFLPDGEPIATIPKDGVITAAALAPDGRTLVLRWKAGTIHLYQVGRDKDREPTLLEGHFGPVRAMAFSRDGEQLAVGDDVTIHVWMLGDAPTKRSVPRADAVAVTCVAFTPDGNGLVSGSIDKTVRLWDLTGEQPREKICDPMRL
jgi:WD40 repeat protein